jgi:RNA polymerase sigma factor (sigma-70 family)
MGDDLLRDDSRVREGFRRGERWAMNEVYRVYFPIVSIVATRGFGNFRGFFNPADRDDAIQTIFAAAFEEKARHSYNGIDPYKSFLRGLAHNIVRRMLEKHTRFKRTDWEADPGSPAPDTAEDSLIKAESAQIMRDFKEGLGKKEREILERYYVNGEAEESIAKEVGMTRYKVRKSIAALHRMMQRHVRNYGLG